jgi:hypothetical protein
MCCRVEYILGASYLFFKRVTALCVAGEAVDEELVLARLLHRCVQQVYRHLNVQFQPSTEPQPNITTPVVRALRQNKQQHNKCLCKPTQYRNASMTRNSAQQSQSCI